MRNLFFILLLSFFSISAKDKGPVNYYSEGFRIEKTYPIFSICLYEAALKKSGESKKVNSIALNRLFFLYLKYKRYEDLFILNQKYPPDNLRKRKTQGLIKNIALNIDIEESVFNDIINLSLSNTPESSKELFELYNKTSNIYVLRYIFSIKIKKEDYESLTYIISSIPDLNPVLKLIYAIKAKDAEQVRKIAREVSASEELSDEQKSDILYFYAMHLRNEKQYRQSIRFFRMSMSYLKAETGILSDGLIELSKNLFIIGKKDKACKLLNGKIIVQNESDELLNIYCKQKDPGRETLKSLRLSFEVLAQKENGHIFRKVLKTLSKKGDAGDE